jgi:hypothetical protein
MIYTLIFLLLTLFTASTCNEAALALRYKGYLFFAIVVGTFKYILIMINIYIVFIYSSYLLVELLKFSVFNPKII